MVRAALASRRRINQGPRAFARWIPALSVLAASLLNLLPIVSTSGWYPDVGFLTLIAWRLLRADPWPAWWAAPLGLANDLLAGFPIGLSVFLWASAMLILELLDRRTMWRDYWIEWLLAALLLVGVTSVHWWIANLTGARLPFMAALPALLIGVFVFPIVAWFIAQIDRWRLGR
jgi:rod shape-determining protein MreD